MAFAVVCKSCQSRFLLNDDLLKRRVAGRVVTVRCRQCHAAIEVDASQVDAEAAPTKTAELEPVAPRPLTFKPAPHPPRPTKSSTLIGIGAPARPAGSTELVALSPGLLNVNRHAQESALDFPEPPPPPPLDSSPLEELNADDWEIAETPPLPAADAAPESVDDFIEELPPSIPTPADEEQTQLIPAKQLLASKAPVEVVLANEDEEAAHDAIDIPLSAPASTDLTPEDVPLVNPKSTLPLFALNDDHAQQLPAAPHAPMRKPRPPQPPLSAHPSPAGGSLSPAAIDPPASADRPDSARTRKKVVAPAAKSDPPPLGERKRSALSVPILGALALAAGVLIWKRGVVPPEAVSAPKEPPAAAALEATPAPITEASTGASIAPTPTSAPSSETKVPDDVTFENAPTPTAAAKVAAAAHHTPSTSRVEREPAAAPAITTTKTVAAPSEPAVASTEPKTPTPEPAAPSGPVGDFDPAAAAAALTASAAQASACRKEGDPSGVASVVITFAPSGRVTSANISGPPFAGTPTGGCIAAALRKARVPAFDGDRVTVSKTIVIH